MVESGFAYTIARFHSRANNAIAEMDKQDALVSHGAIRADVAEDRSFVRLAMVEILNKTDIRESDVTLELLNEIEKIVNRVRDTNRVAEYPIDSILDYMDSALDVIFPEVIQKENDNKNNGAPVAGDHVIKKIWKPWTAVVAAGTLVLGVVEGRNWRNRELEKQTPTPIEDVQAHRQSWTECAAKEWVDRAAKKVNFERE